MAEATRDVETISNMSGNTLLLSPGDDENLTSFVESNRNNTLAALPGDSTTSRPASYAAAAAHGTTNDRHSGNSTNRPSGYRSEQYLTNFERANFNKDNVTPDRPCTAYFNSDIFENSNAVFEALKNQDFDARAIRCLQRKPSGDMLISFATSEMKRKFVYRNVMQIEGRSYAINDGDRRLAYLNIYDAPYELPDVALAHRLEPFCEVLHMRRGKFSNGVFNGNRHFRVRITAPIPSYLRFGKFLVRLSHDGQDHTCRRCNRVGHFANDCTNTFCFNCEELGHMAGSCPNAELCCICKSHGHRARYCPFSWHRTSPPSSPGHNSPPARPTTNGTWPKPPSPLRSATIRP